MCALLQSGLNLCTLHSLQVTATSLALSQNSEATGKEQSLSLYLRVSGPLLKPRPVSQAVWIFPCSSQHLERNLKCGSERNTHPYTIHPLCLRSYSLNFLHGLGLSFYTSFERTNWFPARPPSLTTSHKTNGSLLLFEDRNLT